MSAKKATLVTIISLSRKSCVTSRHLSIILRAGGYTYYTGRNLLDANKGRNMKNVFEQEVQNFFRIYLHSQEGVTKQQYKYIQHKFNLFCPGLLLSLVPVPPACF